ncbi:MAG: CPBP family intramembrane glutamic endopeptidase [Flavobacteriales bacterium]
MIKKSIIMRLSLATIVGMSLVAVIIDRFSETVNLAESFLGFVPWWQQIVAGTAAGLISALIAYGLISMPFLRKVNGHYANMFGRFQLSLSEILFISVCAGVGEEILFRGAIQPLAGIMLTAVIFVGIHGYLSPYNWRLTIYGAVLTVLMYGIGYMSQQYGLASAIIAHTVIDAVLLYKLQHWAGEVDVDENTSIPDDFSEDFSQD